MASGCPVRAWSRHFQPADCGPLIRALSDRSFAVRLEAIDRLGGGCSARAIVSDALRPLVDSLTATSGPPIGTAASWHRGAHALVALARIAS